MSNQVSIVYKATNPMFCHKAFKILSQNIFNPSALRKNTAKKLLITSGIPLPDG